MNSNTTRILKEARPLLWPWCAVAIAGVLRLVPLPSNSLLDGVIREGINPMGLFLGIPLLATLAWGNEFQYRTLSLLLTQPVDRQRIWKEKLSVTAVAVMSAALIYFFAGLMSRAELEVYLACAAWIIATTASATFWMLVAKSTLGGLVLNIAVHAFAIIFCEWRWGHLHGSGEFSAFSPSLLSIATLLLLSYGFGMLWLGRRMLARCEVTGGMGGDDLLMAGSGAISGIWGASFRCHPNTPVLNLIRKELGLLRPLCAIAVVDIFGWIYLLAFHLVPRAGSNQNVPIAFGLVTTLSILIAILAGSLSLGEEGTSGIHAWQLTLPVSAFRQWLIKLLTALFLAEVCGVLLPLLVLVAGGSLSGSPLMFVDIRSELWVAVAVLLLSFAAFWCASCVNGTVRAALFVFPALWIIAIAGGLADRLGPLLERVLAAKLNLFTSLKFAYAVSNVTLRGRETPTLTAYLFFIPILLFAVFQSYQLFRNQVADSTARIIRQLMPVALITIVCGSALGAFDDLIFRAMRERYMFFGETRQAIEKVVAGRSLDPAHPLQLTSDDLAVSQRTRRWLTNSTITVAPGRPPEYWIVNSTLGKTSWDLVTIDFQNGFQCTLSFPTAGSVALGVSRPVCN